MQNLLSIIVIDSDDFPRKYILVASEVWNYKGMLNSRLSFQVSRRVAAKARKQERCGAGQVPTALNQSDTTIALVILRKIKALKQLSASFG
jgi:hypothetical protein